MEIRDHRLVGKEFIPTSKMSGFIVPRAIVLHYTAGWTTQGDVDTLAKSDRKASAHTVVGRDGETIQIVPFNRKAWHAGPSQWPLDVEDPVYTDLNAHSIGIEISNAGWIKRLSNGNYQDQYGQEIAGSGRFVHQNRATHSPPNKWHEEFHPRLARGTYVWEPFYEEQLLAVDEQVAALLRTYSTIEHILTHEEIDTRGWKTDPGPMMPLRRYTKLTESRADDGDEPSDE